MIFIIFYVNGMKSWSILIFVNFLLTLTYINSFPLKTKSVGTIIAPPKVNKPAKTPLKTTPPKPDSNPLNPYKESRGKLNNNII